MILYGISPDYKDSPPCRLEANYAFQLNKRMVPLMLTDNYKPKGWLGIMLGTRLWYGFFGDVLTEEATFNAKMDALCRELGPPYHGNPDGPMSPMPMLQPTFSTSESTATETPQRGSITLVKPDRTARSSSLQSPSKSHQDDEPTMSRRATSLPMTVQEVAQSQAKMKHGLHHAAAIQPEVIPETSTPSHGGAHVSVRYPSHGGQATHGGYPSLGGDVDTITPKSPFLARLRDASLGGTPRPSAPEAQQTVAPGAHTSHFTFADAAEHMLGQVRRGHIGMHDLARDVDTFSKRVADLSANGILQSEHRDVLHDTVHDSYAFLNSLLMLSHATKDDDLFARQLARLPIVSAMTSTIPLGKPRSTKPGTGRALPTPP